MNAALHDSASLERLVPWPTLRKWLSLTVIVWAVVLASIVVSGTVAQNFHHIAGWFGQQVDRVTVDWSTWGMLSPIGSWVLAWAAGVFLYTFVPVIVATGRTRHESAISAAILLASLLVVVSMLTTLGFVMERGIYAVAGWQRGTADDIFFTSYNDYGWILLRTVVTCLLMASGGALIGSAVQRSRTHGGLAIGLSFVALTITGLQNDGDTPFIGLLVDFGFEQSRLFATVMAVITSLVLAAVTYWNVSRLQVRNR